MNDKFEQYIKRASVVTVYQYDGSYQSAMFIVNETQYSKTPATYQDQPTPFHDNTQALRIQTLEGLKTVQEGDFVVRAPAGDFYPCKPDVFNRLYFPVKMAV